MPVVLFNFARNLKISRFMIDLLMHRLQDLKPRSYHASAECVGLVGWAHERVAACDQLHNELRELFRKKLDVDAIASLNAGLAVVGDGRRD